MSSTLVFSHGELGFSFDYVVPNFETSRWKKGEHINSPTHQFMGFNWSLLVYPFGHTGASDNIPPLGVYVWCKGPQDYCRLAGANGKWASPPMNYTLSTMTHCRRASGGTFTSDTATWGWASFLLRSEVKGGGDGSLVFRAVLSAPDDGTESCGRQFSCLSMLDDPVTSFADVRLQGFDGDPIRSHRSVLCHRLRHFATMFADGVFEEGCKGDGIVKFEDVGGDALNIFVRRIYGAPFPERLYKEEHVQAMLELWRFVAVRMVDSLREECVQIVRHSVNAATLSRCFNMANLLDDKETQRVLAAMVKYWDEGSAARAVKSLSFGDFSALVRRLPATLKTARLADSWWECEPEREEHGAAILDSIDFTKLPKAKMPDLASLGIVEKCASRDCLLYLVKSSI
jgi:hypothetical protein